MTGARKFEVIVGNTAQEVVLSSPGKARIVDKDMSYSVTWMGQNRLQLIVEGAVYRIQCESRPEEREAGRPMVLRVNGRRTVAIVHDEGSKLAQLFAQTDQQSSRITTISAPMPGLVSKLEVARGDRVVPGQGLVILEAMKMENELRSSVHGEVEEVFVRAGRPVEKGEALLRIGTSPQSDSLDRSS